MAEGTGRGNDARVRLRLTVRSEGTPDRDVEVDAGGGATARELSAALARHVGLADRGVLHCARLGTLPGELALERAGLRDGDVVGLAPVASEHVTHAGANEPHAELMVVGGPVAGVRVAIGAGTHVVGREPGSADLVIDDPSISRRHLTIGVDGDGATWVEDAGSTNGTALDGVRLGDGERRVVAGSDHVEAGRSLLSVRPYRRTDRTIVSSRGARVAFNRPPRVSRVFDPATFRVAAPPEPPRGGRLPLIAAIVPVLMGVTLWVVVHSPVMLMMAIFSPVMVIGSALADRRSGRREHADQRAEFEARVERLDAELAAARTTEVAERRAAAPDAAELAVRARRRLPELWERRPGDADFLDVRVAIADQPSVTAVAFADGGDPELRQRVEERVERNRLVPNVPVRVRLRDVGAIGISGDRRAAEAMARWLVVQAAVLQSPRDLVIAAALSEERAADWRWLGWLPHVTSESSPLDGPHVAVGHEPARELIRRVAQLAEERRSENEGRGRGRRRTTLLLVDDEVGAEPAVVDELLADCRDVDVAAIWLARERRDLPGGCGAIVELAAERAVAHVTWTSTGSSVEAASADGIPLEVAESVARALAPVVDVSAGGASAELPRHASLVELLDLVEPTASRVVDRWRARTPAAGLSATLGAAAGRPFALDLRADGPHALIAGTTGAGKSELLRSLVVALATSHPPDRLAFLLVDYKGGAAFKDCRHLPHSVGMVTDLDPHEVHRVLVSLNAELKRREHVLKDANASDLVGLERRDPAGAPPSLVIVIDEFATLAKEVPEFVEGIVDVAQRGRSLGVHAVLATQRPGNAVTDNIRANTNLRIALRVATAAESSDVIGAPDAARLLPSLHGRALARTGPSELVPFQVGYVGGLTSAARQVGAIEIADLDFGVPVAPPAAGGDAHASADERTDLDALVAAIREATAEARIPPPAPPWLPPLPEAISLEEAGANAPPRDARDGVAAVGVIDEPRRQRQLPFELDLPADGSLLAFGATGSGKTTLLRTVALALAERSSPDDLQLYGLDFAGRGLHALEALPHCGSIVAGEDEERVARLLALLRRTIDRRSRRFAAAGVATLTELRRLEPGEPLPRIAVLVDSYAGFVDAYDRVDLGTLVDALPRLVADGRAAGVHFAITADRRQAIPTSIASVVARRVILRMAVEEEYAALGLDTREVRGAVLTPGRGFLDDGREVQIAVAGGSTESEVQARALAEAAGRLTALHQGRVAPPVTVVPTQLARTAVAPAERPLAATLGVEESELAPYEVSLADMHYVVIGPYRSGRTTALATLVAGLRAATPGLRTHLLAPRRSELTELDGWTSTARGGDACDARIPELLDAMLAPDGADETPTLVVIDDGGELAESRAASELEQLVKRGRDRSLRVLAAFETGHARHYAPWIRELRKDSHGLLLDPSLELDGELLGARLPRRTNAVHPPGRGYAVADGAVTLVQVAR